MGGYSTPPATRYANTETWNGSSWTETTDMNTARRNNDGSGPSSSSAIYAGGFATAGSALTETWDGTTWTETADLSVARYGTNSSGTATSALAAGGYSQPASSEVASVEEFAANAPVGAWATGGSLNQSRYGMMASGTVTASIAFGGRISPPNAYSALNEQYDGTSWTEVADLNTARAFAGSTTGPYTAVLGFGGNSGSNQSINEQWNGSAWTETTDMNTAKSNVAGCGTTTAALATGGTSNTNESWNGSAWTEVNDLNTARNGVGPNSSGTSTATLIAGGEQPASPYALYANSELWNGSSWTEVNDLNTARHQLGHSGTSTLALAFGGAPIPAAAGKTEDWNGASWSEVADMSTARGYPASSGSSTAALATGGTIPPGASSTATEEWSGSSDIIKVLTD